MQLLFATNNEHKLNEVRFILPDFDIKSLKDININIEIPEDFETLTENAHQKAQYIYNITKNNVIADDTGLEVEELGGKPGVYSARYAGDNCSFEDNVCKLLEEMKGFANRKARFRTVVALIINGKEHIFEGIVNGVISEFAKGNNGFGYDSVFIPEGYNETFAQMNTDKKNSISHRKLAFYNVSQFLNS